MTWLLANVGRTFWMPERASSYARGVDLNFYFVLGVSVFFTLLILGVLVLFIFKYRQRPGHRAEHTATHNTALEITWTVIPLVIVLLIFYFNFRVFLNMFTPPPGTYDINVTAYKWGWGFTYPNGHTDPQLYVPKDRDVRLILTSQDVIHSLYIPAFRIKMDAVPGRYNVMWFRATETGPINPETGEPEGFILFCAEYCGTGHNEMFTRVLVYEPHEFVQKLEEISDWTQRITPVERGREIWATRGCNQCHTLDGTSMTGPTFLNVFGAERQFTDGTSAIADENYIRESILYPERRIVRGYQNVMPSYRGQLRDNDIDAVIAFMKSISRYHAPTPDVTAEPGE